MFAIFDLWPLSIVMNHDILGLSLGVVLVQLTLVDETHVRVLLLLEVLEPF